MGCSPAAAAAREVSEAVLTERGEEEGHLLVEGPPGSGKSCMAGMLLVDKGLLEVGIAVVLVDLLLLLPAALLQPLKVEDDEIERQLSTVWDDVRERLIERKQMNRGTVLIIDELDLMCSRDFGPWGKVTALEHMQRVSSSFLDLLASINRRQFGNVVVVGLVRDAAAITGLFKKAERFSRVVSFGIPSCVARTALLLDLLAPAGEPNEVQVALAHAIAEKTPGFVAKDIHLLWQRACRLQLSSSSEENPELEGKSYSGVTLTPGLHHFEQALSYTKAAQLNALEEELLKGSANTGNGEGLSALAGCAAAKDAFEKFIHWPLLYPEQFKRFQVSRPNGVLLYGPPGCGKTLCARALKQEYDMNFLAAKGPQLLFKYVGETEEAIRKLFMSAHELAPCILFFDEVDAIGRKRSGSDGASGVQERALSTLLNEMDGIEERAGVFLVGCTSRPDLMDSALLRPGRFDKLVHVPLPSSEDRKEFLEIQRKRMPLLLEKEQLEKIVEDTTAYSFSDMKGLLRAAGLCALRRDLETGGILFEDVTGALESFSVHPPSRELLEIYKRTEDGSG